MIVVLREVPRSPDEWATWGWHHRQDHAEIGDAIQTQKNLALTEYELDPIPLDPTDWSQRHQQRHYDEDNATGVVPAQIGALEPQGAGLADWIEAHYQNHVDKRTLLKI